MTRTRDVARDRDVAARSRPRVPDRDRALGFGMLGFARGLLEPGTAPLVAADVLVELAAASTVVELMRKPVFDPGWAMGTFIEASGDAGARVSVRFGDLASGAIIVRAASGGYETPEMYWLRLDHPGFESRAADRELGIGVEIENSVVSGAIGVREPNSHVANTDTWLYPIIFGRSYTDPSSIDVRSWENQLRDGQLLLRTMFRLQPPDGPPIAGSFRLWDEEVSFDADIEVHGWGLESTEVPVERTPAGLLTAREPVELSEDWEAGGFSGQVNVSFVDGSFEARSKVDLRYPSDGTPWLTGSMSILATTEDKAWAAARTHNPAPDVTGVIEPMVPGRSGMALTGWGVLDLQVTEGLKATGSFVVDPEGYVTARGVLRGPRELTLLDAYDPDPDQKWKREWRWELADVPLYWFVSGEVRVYVYLIPSVTVGPFTLRDILIQGVYSNRPEAGSLLEIAASLNGSAEARVTAGAKLEGALEVGVDLDLWGWEPLSLDIDLATVDAKVEGTAALKAYVDARPTFTREGSKDPTQPAKYRVKGTLEAGGELDVSLSASAGVSILSTISDRFSIGGGKYPLAGAAVRVDIDHVIGSGDKPKVKFTRPQFDRHKFVRFIRGQGRAPRDTSAGVKGEFRDVPSRKRTAISTTAPAPLAPPPEAGFELKVPFEIDDRPHELFLVLSRPPVLEVASKRRRLSEQLEIARERIGYELTWATDLDRIELLQQQAADLVTLISDAIMLEDQASKLGADPTELSATDLPGLHELAERIAEYGERYHDQYLVGVSRLTTKALEPTVAGPSEAVAVEPWHATEGRVGTYDSLLGPRGDRMTPHHMPQDAFMKGARRGMDAHGDPLYTKGSGICFNMHESRHYKTRTYGGRGKNPDLTRSPLAELQDDIDDVRSVYKLFGLYNAHAMEIERGLDEVLRQNQAAHPGFFK